MRFLVTGATGLIGRALLRNLDDVVVLARNPERARAELGDVRAFAWQAQQELPPAEAFEGVDIVVHLAGEPVASEKWSEEKKRAIRDSRVIGTRNLVDGLAALSVRPSVLVSASAVGYYGDRADEQLTEEMEAGVGFLAEVCVEWEAEAAKARALGLRVISARTGIVLAAEDGALSRMLTPFRLGLGGRLGGGQQWMPWVHIDDVVGLLLHASRTARLDGPMNVVAPNPVSNRAFTKALGRALRRPAFLPVPRFALRAAFGEMSEVLLASQRAVPHVAEQSGYLFAYAKIDAALNACLIAPTRSMSD